MKCESVKKVIWGIFDQEVELKVKEAVEKHIAECSNCQSVYEDVRKMLSAIGNMPKEEVPSNFISGLKDKIIFAAGESKRKRYSFTFKPAFAFAAGAAIVLLLFLMRPFHTPSIKYVSPDSEMKLANFHRSSTLIRSKSAYLRLNLNSKSRLDDVTLEIELPDGLTLADGRKNARWSGDLRKGKNVILLRVKGETTGTWDIRGVLEKEGRRKSFTKKVRVI